MRRTIVITGVTRGLGRALAHRFAEAGHTVIGCGRSAEHVAALREVYGAPHRLDVVDVADDRAVAQWASDVIDTHGAPDLLINNAALINRNNDLWDVPAAEFDAVIDVNLKGVANVIRHFVPAMIDARRGVIVNLSSGWGRSTSPQVAPYCCTKWGIEGLTQAMAQELPRGLAAVAVNPGVIDTDMLRTCWADGAASFPDADTWSQRAAPFMLNLTASDNGASLSV
ncbi:MAG: SDR family NAD(P)-dependent oxidoreductase [Phycisphaera sp.]|nr:SDR family NAD(P)-dependent oxidoreductase [Phycisphaera sp.]